MIFLAPDHANAALRVPFASLRKAPKSGPRRLTGDEDGARRALGPDASLPPAVLAGASIEHLARIALG